MSWRLPRHCWFILEDDISQRKGFFRQPARVLIRGVHRFGAMRGRGIHQRANRLRPRQGDSLFNRRQLKCLKFAISSAAACFLTAGDLAKLREQTLPALSS